jgi:aryl-alcohol dehydrogenase-like predicted oxidoreductase
MSKRISIPDTDLSAFPLGLGTAMAGIEWAGKEADNLLDAFVDMGGNLVDTARIYSDWIPPEIGRSERVIGDWLQRGGKRNRIVLMSKGGHPKFTNPSDDLHISRMSRAEMRQDIELSLKALRVDTIDIYFYHRDNPAQTVEAEIETMEQFRHEGKIRYYGCSNWQAVRIRAADVYCKEKGYRGFVADEALLNLGMKYMHPLPDDTMAYMKDDLFKYHQENLRNLAMPYMSIAGGFFHFFAAGGEEAVKNSPYSTPENGRVAKRCMELAEKYNVSLSQVLLAFFSCQPFPCVPLYGPQNTEVLKDAMGYVSANFDKEDFDI